MNISNHTAGTTSGASSFSAVICKKECYALSAFGMIIQAHTSVKGLHMIASDRSIKYPLEHQDHVFYSFGLLKQICSLVLLLWLEIADSLIQAVFLQFQFIYFGFDLKLGSHSITSYGYLLVLLYQE